MGDFAPFLILGFMFVAGLAWWAVGQWLRRNGYEDVLQRVSARYERIKSTFDFEGSLRTVVRSERLFMKRSAFRPPDERKDQSD